MFSLSIYQKHNYLDCLFLHSTFHTISTLPSFIPHSVFICRLSSRSPILSALSLHLLEHSSLTSLPLSVLEWKQQVNLSPSKFAGVTRSKTGGSGLCCYFRCNKQFSLHMKSDHFVFLYQFLLGRCRSEATKKHAGNKKQSTNLKRKKK